MSYFLCLFPAPFLRDPFSYLWCSSYKPSLVYVSVSAVSILSCHRVAVFRRISHRMFSCTLSCLSPDPFQAPTRASCKHHCDHHQLSATFGSCQYAAANTTSRVKIAASCSIALQHQSKIAAAPQPGSSSPHRTRSILPSRHLDVCISFSRTFQTNTNAEVATCRLFHCAGDPSLFCTARYLSPPLSLSFPLRPPSPRIPLSIRHLWLSFKVSPHPETHSDVAIYLHPPP